MPEDDEKRTADTIEEIRDLLIEMRDAEKARAEESWRIQEVAFKRQKVLQLVGLIILVPAVLYLAWAILREM